MIAAASLRVAVIGYGLAGSVFHAPLIAATPGLQLDSIVTGNQQRATAARQRYPAVRIVADAAALWQAPPDLVVVATPNRSHAPLALAALRAGCAVVVDKPLAVTAADAAQLVAAAHRSGKLLSVFQNRRWDGDFLTLQQLLASDQLGAVFRFESRFERWRPEPRPGWRQGADPRDGGGVVLDLGSHLIDQAIALFGPVQSLHAELARRHPEAEVEDDALIVLEHVGGTRSHLWMSSMAAHAGPRLRVLGRDAAYVKYGLDGQEAQLRAGMSAAAAGFGVEAEPTWGRLHRGDEASALPTLRGQWTRYYADIEQALRTHTPPPVAASDALRVLQLITAARQSALRRLPVAIDPASGALID